MARVCDICGKKPLFGKRISHSHRRTPRRWNVNIQKIHAIIDGSPKTINICAKCMKSSKVARAY